MRLYQQIYVMRGFSSSQPFLLSQLVQKENKKEKPSDQIPCDGPREDWSKYLVAVIVVSSNYPFTTHQIGFQL